MRVVDTSIWIEWLINSPLSQAIAESFPETTECIVPTIVQLELCKWLMREVGETEADQVIAYTQNCVVAALDTKSLCKRRNCTANTNSPLRMPLYTRQHWHMTQI